MNDLQKPFISVGMWATAGVLVAVVALLIIWSSMGKHDHASTEGFLGPEVCGECHKSQYMSWSQTRMAQTFEVLRPGAKRKEKELAGLDPEMDYTHEEECLPCHTTGYGLVGGFTSIEETPQHGGVGCEACHGAGGMYVNTVMSPDRPNFTTIEAVSRGLVYPPTELVCRKCHNENSPFIDMGYIFDFSERVKRGTHEHYELTYEHGG